MSGELIDLNELRRALAALGVPDDGELEPLAYDIKAALRLATLTKRAARVGRPRDPARIALSCVAQLHFMRITRRPPSANTWPKADGDTAPRGSWPAFVQHVFASAGLRASTTDMRR